MYRKEDMSDIKRDKNGRILPIPVDMDYVTEEFVNKKRSLSDISKEIGVDRQVVVARLQKMGIDHKRHDKDLTGCTFFKLKVIKRCGYKSSHGDILWSCECDCGKILNVRQHALIGGKAKSCGCARIKHGQDIHHGIYYSFFSQIKRHATCRTGDKSDFNITIEYIWGLYLKQDKKCALSGMAIKIPSSCHEMKNKFATASLDRIDSSKGYIEGNVQWVHKDINRIKTDLKQEDFIDLCRSVVHKNKPCNNKANVTRTKRNRVGRRYTRR